MPEKTVERRSAPLTDRRWMLLIAAVAAIAFLPGIGQPFLVEWDDGGFVTENPYLLPSWRHAAYWLTHNLQTVFTPVSMESLMLDRALFGLRPWGYHLHNLLLHLAAAVLLFRIFRRFGVQAVPACLLTLWWAVSPQRVESVVWITERKDVLSGALAFGAVPLLLRAVDRRAVGWGAGVLTVLAIGAKPSCLPLPGVLLLAAWAHAAGDWRRALRAASAPLIAGGLAAGWVTAMTAGEVGGVLEAWPRWLLVPLHNLGWYFDTALWPLTLNPVYPRVTVAGTVWAVLLAACWTAALWSAAGDWRRAVRPVAAALGAWLMLLVPLLGVVRMTNTDYCDRYNYLPSAAVLLAVGLLTEAARRRGATRRTKRLATTAGALLAATGVVWCWYEIGTVWRDTGTLFRTALERGGAAANPKAVEGVGLCGLNRGDPELLAQSGLAFRRLADAPAATTLAPEPATREGWRQNGDFLLMQALAHAGDWAALPPLMEPLLTASRAGRLRLYNAEVWEPRLWRTAVEFYLRSGRTREADAALAEQLRRVPPAGYEAAFLRGVIAWRAGRAAEAETAWRRALELRPGDDAALRNLREAAKKRPSAPQPSGGRELP